MIALTINGTQSIKMSRLNTVLEALRAHGYVKEAPCGGKGSCGKCAIKVIEGNDYELAVEELKGLSKQQVDEGYRLACLFKPKVDTWIELDTRSEEPSFLIEDTQHFRKMTPSVEKRFVSIEPYESPGFTQCFYHDHLSGSYTLCKEFGDTTNLMYGLAIDIGTTTVVGNLIDLNTGNTVGVRSILNPQKVFGLDVLSRIEYQTNEKQGLNHLHQKIISGINEMIVTLTEKAGIKKSYVYDIVIAANATMVHFLLNKSAESIGKAPYKPLVQSSVGCEATMLGIDVAEHGRVWVLPPISAFIGADITAGILATELYERADRCLFIDIGTNGELVLTSRGTMLSCSCAAGPALEGMNISCGMRAAKGAVENVDIDDELNVRFKVIGKGEPIGICGSGIIDTMAEVVRHKLVGKTGRIVAPDKIENNRGIVEEADEGRVITLRSAQGSIRITQNDIRQIQLAKGAILSGIYALVEAAEVTFDDIDHVIIAGQFGRHVREKSLGVLGLVPEALVNKLEYAGNSSIKGAALCLVNREKRMLTEKIAKKINYIELATQKDYDRLFAKCLHFY